MVVLAGMVGVVVKGVGEVAVDQTAAVVGLRVAVDQTAAVVGLRVVGASMVGTGPREVTAGSETDAHRSHGSRCPYRKRCTLILVRRHRSHHQMNMRTSPCTGRLAMVGTATAAEVWRWEPKSGQRRETMWGL